MVEVKAWKLNQFGEDTGTGESEQSGNHNGRRRLLHNHHTIRHTTVHARTMLQAELIAAQTPPRTIARAVMADAGKAGAVGAGGGRGGISEARRSIPSERMEGTVCEVCEVNSKQLFSRARSQ